MRTLLISPLRLMDLTCGDDIITELLLAHPPDGVAYTHYGQGLEAGWLKRDRGARPWLASLVMHSRPPAGVPYRWADLPPWPYRLLSRVLPDRPDVDIQWLRLDDPSRFDLVHSYTYPVRLDAPRRLPLVLSTGSGNTDLMRHYHGYSEHDVDRLARRDARLLRRLDVAHDMYHADAARLITVPSRYAMRLHTELGAPESKLRLVRIGFEAPRLPAPRPDDGTCRFTLVGHHFRRKGGRALALAFDRLRQLHPEARLTIVSAVDPAELGIDLTGVTVIPGLPREAIYRDIYPETDVYLLPSLAEGYGMSVVEAMSFGKPVIASGISALPELVRDGETGLLVAPDDADALYEAMRTLMEDPALRARMGAAGRAAFDSEHALAVTNRALRAVYDEALG
ncbi:MAG: glycosyltransferase family 4 protein [Candidatus Sericytochromatia bacterium]